MTKRILIADDDAGFRQVIKERLFNAFKLANYEAANGREALELAAKSKPDLVILDVSMPEMDGIAAAKRLKARMPEIPVVLFTMYNLEENAATLGVDAVISKSCFGKLMNTVSALLKLNPANPKCGTKVTSHSTITMFGLDR